MLSRTLTSSGAFSWGVRSVAPRAIFWVWSRGMIFWRWLSSCGGTNLSIRSLMSVSMIVAWVDISSSSWMANVFLSLALNSMISGDGLSPTRAIVSVMKGLASVRFGRGSNCSASTLGKWLSSFSAILTTVFWSSFAVVEAGISMGRTLVIGLMGTSSSGVSSNSGFIAGGINSTLISWRELVSLAWATNSGVGSVCRSSFFFSTNSGSSAERESSSPVSRTLWSRRIRSSTRKACESFMMRKRVTSK